MSRCSPHNLDSLVVCIDSACGSHLCYKCLLHHDKTHEHKIIEFKEFIALAKKLNVPPMLQDSTQTLMEEIQQMKRQHLLSDQLIKKNLYCGKFELIDEANSLKQFFFCKGLDNGCTSKNEKVWGSLNYTSDSDLCLAAAHSGVMERKMGGFCLVEGKPGMKNYYGSNENGVRSLHYGVYKESISFIKK